MTPRRRRRLSHSESHPPFPRDDGTEPTTTMTARGPQFVRIGPLTFPEEPKRIYSVNEGNEVRLSCGVRRRVRRVARTGLLRASPGEGATTMARRGVSRAAAI